jgi:hypothetical protein
MKLNLIPPPTRQIKSPSASYWVGPPSSNNRYTHPEYEYASYTGREQENPFRLPFLLGAMRDSWIECGCGSGFIISFQPFSLFHSNPITKTYTVIQKIIHTLLLTKITSFSCKARNSYIVKMKTEAKGYKDCCTGRPTVGMNENTVIHCKTAASTMRYCSRYYLTVSSLFHN